jgi:hypothetical protein
MNVAKSNYLRQLRQLIDGHFRLSEIRKLCFDLGVDPEHLPGDERRSVITSLLLHLTRRKELNRLLDLVRAERPNIIWPDMPPEVKLMEEFETFSENKTSQSGNITIQGNVGPGAAIGHGTSIEARNIAGRDIHDSGSSRTSLTWSTDIDLSLPSSADVLAGAKRSWFIRLKVTNVGQFIARNCFGRLLKVTDEQGQHLKQFDSLDLYWTRQDTPETFAPIDIRENGGFQYLDVAQVMEAESVLAPRVVIPERHRLVIPAGQAHRPDGLFPGTYYMEIVLYADNASISPTWFKVEWNDDYSIEPYTCSIEFGVPSGGNE